MARTSRKDDGAQELLFVTDHKDAYRQIRNYLAGRLVGATRDEFLLEEVIKCLFCKIHIKRQGMREKISDPVDIAKQYRQTFAELRELLPATFKPDDELQLDPTSLAYVDSKLDSIEQDK